MRRSTADRQPMRTMRALEAGCTALLLLGVSAVAQPSHASEAQQTSDPAPSCRNATVGQSCGCAIADLKPTQFAVGMDEVRSKARELMSRKPKSLQHYQLKHPEPVVKGPGQTLYIIDGHHQARALAEIGVSQTVCSISADLSAMPPATFLTTMAARNWLFLEDENGKPAPASALPQSVLQLKDDPYRSLAGAVREAHGFKKSPEPFAEFRWADFFRARIPNAAQDPNGALQQAIGLAASAEACGLPGHKGNPC